MPLPAAHFRPVQSAVKTANAKVWGVAASPLRAVSAIGSRRFCSSNSAAQSYQICHSEERSDVGISCSSPRIRRGFPTIRLCTAEIAASACGLLAMTHQVILWCTSALLPLNCCVQGAQGAPLQADFGSLPFKAAGTKRQCLPEIATSACGLLAMTNLGVLRRRIHAAHAARLHGAQGASLQAPPGRLPF